jgi:tRNA threonylcarbamoyl adenosine modification protein YeaZ
VKILAIDAALGPFSTALDLDGTVSADRSEGPDALEAGLGRVARLLERARLRPAELDRIAVGVGPGSFTGIRIALSYAKALAFAARVPLVGVSSYDISTPPDLGEPCLTVIAGRPGVVCARLVAAGRSATACGDVKGVFARLLALVPSPGPPPAIVAAEDVFRVWGEGSDHAGPRRSPNGENPAVVIARLARIREPAPSPHAVMPDYGEMPAVTRPKDGTKTHS